MKILSAIIMLLSTLAVTNQSMAQSKTPHNPVVEAASLEKSNNEVLASFTYRQELSDYDANDSLSFIPVKMTLCLLNLTPADGVHAIEGSFGDKFSWQYDPVTNCFLGKQSETLEANDAGRIQIVTLPTHFVSCEDEDEFGFNVNIQPAPCMNGVNKLEDDHVSMFSCDERLSTSISNELDKTDYEIYPNPVIDELIIEFSRAKHDVEIEIVDMHGQRASFVEFDSMVKENINISKLPAAAYTIRIATSEGSVFEKIVKTKH